MEKRIVYQQNTAGAVGSGAYICELPEDVTTFEGYLNLLSGTAAIDKMTKIEVIGQLADGSTRQLWDLTGTNLDALMTYYKDTAYATSGQLRLDFGFGYLNGILDKRRNFLSVKPSVMPGTPDAELYYKKAYIKVTLASATSAVLEVRFVTGELTPMVNGVKRVTSYNITCVAATEKTSDDIPYGEGEHRYHCGLHIFAPAGTITGTKILAGTGRTEIFNWPVADENYLCTRAGYVIGSTIDARFEPMVDQAFDPWDTASYTGTKNFKYVLTNSASEDVVGVLVSTGKL
jgi:hypothetical protein